MFGWFKKTVGIYTKDDDAWRTASLRYLRGRLPLVGTTWPSQREVDSARQTLAETRKWVETIPDERMRSECRRWCDFAEDKIHEAQHELDTNEGAMSHERWRQETAENDRAAEEILSRFR